MNENLLLSTSEVFENSNLLDCLRQLCIDFEYCQSDEEIPEFLLKCKNYLDKNLPINTFTEFICTI